MRHLGVGVLSVLVLLTRAPQAWAHADKNVDAAGVILKGYDVTSYFHGAQPRKGQPHLSAQFEGATYLFADENGRKEFLNDPRKFAPRFGGWCAFAVADSKSKVDVDPTSFLIQDGHLLLFYNGLWANTRKKWQKDPQTFLRTADANWPEIEKKEP